MACRFTGFLALAECLTGTGDGRAREFWGPEICTAVPLTVRARLIFLSTLGITQSPVDLHVFVGSKISTDPAMCKVMIWYTCPHRWVTSSVSVGVGSKRFISASFTEFFFKGSLQNLRCWREF